MRLLINLLLASALGYLVISCTFFIVACKKRSRRRTILDYALMVIYASLWPINVSMHIYGAIHKFARARNLMR